MDGEAEGLGERKGVGKCVNWVQATFSEVELSCSVMLKFHKPRLTAGSSEQWSCTP